jgi:hypothetical protein
VARRSGELERPGPSRLRPPHAATAIVQLSWRYFSFKVNIYFTDFDLTNRSATPSHHSVATVQVTHGSIVETHDSIHNKTGARTVQPTARRNKMFFARRHNKKNSPQSSYFCEAKPPRTASIRTDGNRARNNFFENYGAVPRRPTGNPISAITC